MLFNYSQLVGRIAKSSGLDVSEIERKVEAKRAKLSGLVSKEGAAQIVAAELGISFEKEKLRISELVPNMRSINTVGKIINLFPVREFNKNDRSGKVGTMIIADQTGNIRTVLWDTNHIGLFESGKIKQDDVVEITNASIRNNELHLGSFSDIKLSSENLGEVKKEMRYIEKNIVGFKVGESAQVRGVIVQVFEPRHFEVCPQCSKKVISGNCEQHGKVVPKRRALVSVVLDDGSENIRTVLFNEQLEQLGITGEELDSPDLFIKRRDELLGKEAFFCGSVRKNKMFNNLEFFVNEIKQLDIEKVIEALQTA